MDNFLPPTWNFLSWSFSVDIIGHVEKLIKEIDVVHSNNITQFAWILTLTTSSILTSYLYCYIQNNRLRLRFKIKDSALGSGAEIVLMSKLLKDSPLDNILFQSYLEQKDLLLTLENKKVYIGRVIRLGEPNESDGFDQEISIVPLVSGYRDKDTHKVSITTHYRNTESDIELIIRQDQIISATIYNKNVYDALNQNDSNESNFVSKWASSISKILIYKEK